MPFKWIVIHLSCIASALSGQQMKEVFDYQPQQIHIAFGGLFVWRLNRSTWNQTKNNVGFGLISLLLHLFTENVNDIVVTWSTMNDVGKNGSVVEYGINGLTLKAYGTSEKFVDGGAAKHSQYIHRVGLITSQNTLEMCRKYCFSF